MTEIRALELPLLPDGVAVADLEVLLDAVKARLRASVAPQRELSGEAWAARIRRDVLECASALDQLQITLARALSP